MLCMGLHCIWDAYGEFVLGLVAQVRAAALSGDCNWKYEFFRKNFNVAGQHQVRRSLH